MKSVYTTEVFDAWFGSLRDRQAARRIQARIDRVEEGNFGDCQPAGGDKSTQGKDIISALALAQQLQDY